MLAACDLAGLRARGTSLKRVLVDGGRFSGTDLTESALADVLVRDCRADLAAFSGSRLERVRFERCDLRESDFGGIRADALAFDGCDLTGATFSHATLKRSELRGCMIDGLVGVQALRGVTMPLADAMAAAPVLAAALGIRVVR